MGAGALVAHGLVAILAPMIALALVVTAWLERWPRANGR